MDLMERVKEECEKANGVCYCCKLDNVCPNNFDMPCQWYIEAIRNALGEEPDYDKALENINKKLKEEIVVPYRITSDVVKLDPYITADVINAIIICLDQIKERLDG